MKLPQKPQQVVNTTKKLLNDEEFKSHHRTSPKVFLRVRKLTFGLVMLLILQKTMKSLPLRLNEVFGQIDHDLATNSAFLPATQTHDLFLLDGGYASYRWLATGVQHQQHFVVRSSAGSLKPARQLLKGSGADSQVVDLTPSLGQRLFVARLGLPSVLRVRFVRVVLPNGDFEVLVTNWLDETFFPTSSVGQLYHLRWVVETLSGVVKTRLQLEHFSGLTADSVRQDFSATFFITNLESTLCATPILVHELKWRLTPVAAGGLEA